MPLNNSSTEMLSGLVGRGARGRQVESPGTKPGRWPGVPGPTGDVRRGPSAVANQALRQALAGAKLNNKLRAEIGEIADTLQGNLDKVVQHGQRADSSSKTCCCIRARAPESVGR